MAKGKRRPEPGDWVRTGRYSLFRRVLCWGQLRGREAAALISELGTVEWVLREEINP